MKVGLYSITYLGVWYDGPALTLKEFIQRAKRLGFDEQSAMALEYLQEQIAAVEG